MGSRPDEIVDDGEPLVALNVVAMVPAWLREKAGDEIKQDAEETISQLVSDAVDKYDLGNPSD